MAEQSIGMATGAGDGVAGGYPSSRMTAMETKTLSDGLLQTGSKLALTGTGTNTLTIADGAAVVGGYFYENTSSLGIAINSVTNATYNVVVLVNGAAGGITVAQCADGTSVPQYTVRLAVATSAQLSGKTYLQLGTVAISGGTITTISTDYTAYGTTTQMPYQPYIALTGATATLTTAFTVYDLVNYATSTSTTDGIISANTTTGVVTVRRAGAYHVTAYATFTSGTTGNRYLAINQNSTGVLRGAVPAVSATTYVTLSGVIICAAGDTINAAGYSSLAAQSVTTASLTVARV